MSLLGGPTFNDECEYCGAEIQVNHFGQSLHYSNCSENPHLEDNDE